MKQTLPFAIMALCVVALLLWLSTAINFWQSTIADGQPSHESAMFKEFLASQTKALEDQRNDLKASKRKLDEYVVNYLPKFKDEAAKSEQVREVLQKLAIDLLETAKTDPDAKAIVIKADIRQQAPEQKPPLPDYFHSE